MKDKHYFKCPKCRHVSDSKESLESHNDAEHSHFCDKCGGVFDSKEILERHNVDEHSYKCEYCNKVFESTEGLAKHEKETHRKCDLCQDEFVWVDAAHSCYYTKNKIGPDTDRVIVQNVYFADINYYFI